MKGLSQIVRANIAAAALGVPVYMPNGKAPVGVKPAPVESKPETVNSPLCPVPVPVAFASQNNEVLPHQTSAGDAGHMTQPITWGEVLAGKHKTHPTA